MRVRAQALILTIFNKISMISRVGNRDVRAERSLHFLENEGQAIMIRY